MCVCAKYVSNNFSDTWINVLAGCVCFSSFNTRHCNFFFFFNCNDTNKVS